MSQQILKILPEFFCAIADGRKCFEIRRNDRDFREGDSLILQEFDGLNFTGRKLHRVVTYQTTYEQQPGFVVLGIEPDMVRGYSCARVEYLERIQTLAAELLEVDAESALYPLRLERLRAAIQTLTA